MKQNKKKNKNKALLIGLGALVASHFASLGVANDSLEKSSQISQLKQQILAEPHNINRRLQLVEAYVQASQFHQALIELDKLKQNNTPMADWGILAAKTYLGLGRYQNVIDLLDELSDTIEPVTQQLLLAQALLLDRKYDKAKKVLTSSDLVNSPQAHIYLAQLSLFQNDVGSVQQNLEVAERLLSQEKEDNVKSRHMAQVLHLKAEYCRLQGDTSQAQILYQQAIETDPNLFVARLHYVSLLLATRQVTEFIIQANSLYALAPYHKMAMYYGAIAHLESQQTEAAQKILQAGIKQYPSFAENYLLLARSYFDQKQYLQAEQHVKKYMHYKPNHIIATKLLSAIYIRLNQSKDALALLAPLEEKLMEDVNFLSLYGTALLLNQDIEKAQAILAKAQAKATDNPVIATELAITHLRQGEHSEAENLLQRLVDSQSDYIQADVLLVLSLIQSKSYTKAEQVAQNIIAKQPSHPAPYNLLGMVYEQQAKYDLAKQYYLEALKQDKNFVLADNNLSELYLLQQDYAKAEANIQKTLKQQTNDLKALLLMAFLKEQQGQPYEAETWYRKAKTLHGEQVFPAVQLIDFYVRQADYKRANEEADKLHRRFPKAPNVLAKVADLKLSRNDFESALKVFEDWLSVDKNNTYVEYMLAKVSFALNQPKQAKEFLQKAIANNPDYVPALLLQAQVAIREKQYEQAMNLSEKIISLAPDKDFGVVMQGKVFYAMGQYDKSVTAFEKAFQLSPSFGNVTTYFDALIANQKVSQAFTIMDNWLSQHPNHVGGRRFAALRALSLKRTEQAIDYYKKVITLSEGDFVTFNNLAYLYAAQDMDQALHYAEKAYELAPKEPKVMDTLGWILVQKQQAVRALPLLEQALALAPEQLDVQFHLASALHQIGSHKEALELVAKSLQADKPFEEKAQAKKLYQQLQQQMGNE